jgi:hypothetical protein
MPRWERLFYYFECHDRASCITIHRLTVSTPNLREVVISSSIHALAYEDITRICLKLQTSSPSKSLCRVSVSFLSNCKSIQIFDDRAYINTLSQLKGIHTLIIRSHRRRIGAGVGPGSVELPSVHTLILVGPLLELQHRPWLVEFSALQTLEVDPTPPGGQKQWSEMENAEWDEIKRLLTFGVQKLVLKEVWFHQRDVVYILQDLKGWLGELVFVDVTCAIQSGKGQRVEIDLGATLT